MRFLVAVMLATIVAVQLLIWGAVGLALLWGNGVTVRPGALVVSVVVTVLCFSGARRLLQPREPRVEAQH